MLPSFKLIAATFVGSFVLAFTSLTFMDRLRQPLEPPHGPRALLPQNGLPLYTTGATWRAAEIVVPAKFDARFGAEMFAPRPRGEAEVSPSEAAAAAPVSEPPAAAQPDPIAPADGEPHAAAGAVAVPVAPVQIAALPEPQTTPDGAPSPEDVLPEVEVDQYTASIDPDRRSPEPVASAGTSRPEPEPIKPKAQPPQAKPKKTVRSVRQATPARKARKRAARQPAAPPATNSTVANPFSALFGGGAQ